MKKSIISFIAAAFIFMPAFTYAQNTNEDTNAVIDTLTNTVTNIVVSSSLDDVLDEAAKTKIELQAEELINNPGILPDSPLYFFKEWGEGIRMFFTFDDEKKSELDYRYALRKVVEAQKLFEKGKEDVAEKHLKKAEQKFERVRNRLEEQTANGKDVAVLVEKLQLIQARQQEVLLNVYDKVPADAQDSVLRAMENSAKGISNAIEKVKGSGGLNEFQQEIENQIENHGQDTKLKVKTKIQGTETEIQIESEDTDDTDEEDETTSSNAGSGASQVSPGADNESENVNDSEDSESSEGDDSTTESGTPETDS